MNRRLMIAGLSSAAIPMLMLSSSHSARGQTAAGTEPLDLAQYRKMTLLVGSLAKQTSEIALQRATNLRVKQFAGFESAEQTTIAQVLTDVADPPPAPLDEVHQVMLQQLQTLPAGKTFDQAYVEGQLRGHQELLGVQSSFLQSLNAMTALDARHVAMMARTTIMSHLTLLQELQLMLNTA